MYFMMAKKSQKNISIRILIAFLCATFSIFCWAQATVQLPPTSQGEEPKSYVQTWPNSGGGNERLRAQKENVKFFGNYLDRTNIEKTFAQGLPYYIYGAVVVTLSETVDSKQYAKVRLHVVRGSANTPPRPAILFGVDYGYTLANIVTYFEPPIALGDDREIEFSFEVPKGQRKLKGVLTLEDETEWQDMRIPTLDGNATAFKLIPEESNNFHHLSNALSVSFEKFLGIKTTTARKVVGLHNQNSCIARKLRAKGYKDRIDCIKHYNHPLCKHIKRYNAEVNAYNKCL